jgi:hypothetical protein
MAASEAPVRRQPDLALTALYLMRLVLPFGGEGGQFAAEFDDELVTVHPIVEEGKLVADGGNCRRGIVIFRLIELSHSQPFTPNRCQGKMGNR